MGDRLYCTNAPGVYIIYDFESRQVRVVDKDPHVGGLHPELPPFFLDPQTFWAVVNRINELDELSRKRAAKAAALNEGEGLP